MNYNLFLQNSARIDMHGKNISSYYYAERTKPYTLRDIWALPTLGMQGNFIVGHETKLKDVVKLRIANNGEELKFHPFRHRYTPAWLQTEYRCLPDADIYSVSGLISVREEKCILKSDDCFLSKLTFLNEGRGKTKITVSLITPETDGRIKTETITRGMRQTFVVDIACIPFINGELMKEIELDLEPNRSLSIIYGVLFSNTETERAVARAKEIFNKYRDDVTAGYTIPSFIKENERILNDWFENNVPKLQIDNEDVKKVYYYRWYLVYRNIYTPSEVINGHTISGECIYESPIGAWFGCPIGLSVPVHIMEAKWMRNPRTAYSDLKGWCDNVGYYQGYIQYTPYTIWELYRQHPNKEFLSDNIGAILEYAKNHMSLDKIPITCGSWVTGAEYQPSFYQYTEPKWNWKNDNEGQKEGYEPTKLYRIDEIVFNMLNCYGIYRLTEALDMTEESERYLRRFEALKKHIIDNHYDSEKKRFYDIDLSTGKKCDEALSYDSFAPFMRGLIDSNEYADGLFDSITSDSELATRYGIPSSSKDCPMYWFDNCIAGPTNSSMAEPHFYGCSWNGPVWPFSFSIALDGLANAVGGSTERKNKWLDSFGRYTELHFMYGDRSALTVTEHYRGNDGASFSRTYDYFHSCWLDLFFSYYLGIKADSNGEIVCSPFTEEDFTLTDLTFNGRSYKITNTNGKVAVEKE